jgi:GDP-mannose 6-dehydrogenase
MEVVCMDRKLNLSHYYMRPGFAFGGSCLPKDVRALDYRATQVSAEHPLIGALMKSNELQIRRAYEIIESFGDKRVGMLGLSFKTGTDDLRESPLVMVAKRLIGEGCELRIFDPEVQLSRLMGANRSYIEANIPHIASLLCGTIEEMIDPSEVILVGLQQSALNEALQARVKPAQHLIDLVNLPNRDLLRCQYEGACW